MKKVHCEARGFHRWVYKPASKEKPSNVYVCKDCKTETPKPSIK